MEPGNMCVVPDVITLVWSHGPSVSLGFNPRPPCSSTLEMPCFGAHVYPRNICAHTCAYQCIIMYNYVYLSIYLSIYCQIASFLGVLGLKRNSWKHLGKYVPPSQVNNATTTECAKLIDFPLRNINVTLSTAMSPLRLRSHL
jgi:hypothetical protein